MDDKIRTLCQQVVAATDDKEQVERLVELRHALHLHIERLRKRLGEYPLTVERRAQEGIPPPDMENSD